MKSRPKSGFVQLIIALAGLSLAHSAVTDAVVSRKGPTINAGRVKGSVRVMTGDPITLNGGVVIDGSLILPGTPNLIENGTTLPPVTSGTGAALPANYNVTINGRVVLGGIKNKVDPAPLPSTTAPAATAGTRIVTLNKVSDSPGNFATLRSLTLNSSGLSVTVPPGRYESLTVNGGSSLNFQAGTTANPALYEIQTLIVNGTGKITIVGPTAIRVRDAFTSNGTIGNLTHPEWLVMSVHCGNCIINGQAAFHGKLIVPNGTLTVNGNSLLHGLAFTDRLILNCSGVIECDGGVATPVNNPPVASAIQLNLNQGAVNSAVTLTGSDPDAGDTITYQVVTQPTKGTLSGTAPNLTYTHTGSRSNSSDTDSFTFKVVDSKGASSAVAAVTLTLKSVNRPPVATAKSLTTDEDAALTVLLAGTDPDTDPLSFQITAQPAHGVLSGTAPNLTYTPTANYSGPDSIAFTVKDTALTSVAATVSITVRPINDAPTAIAQTLATVEDTPKQIILTGTDIDGDALTYQIATQPTHGTLTGTAPNLTYTPAANYNGPDSFTFVSRDAVHSSAVAIISLTVTPLNDAPVALGQALTIDEDTPKTIKLTGTDIDGDALTFFITTPPAHGTLNGTIPDLIYTPLLNYNGPDTFAFTAKDAALTSAPAAINFTINKINDIPIATSVSYTLAEDASLAVEPMAADVDGDPLTYQVGTQPLHGTLTVQPTGKFLYKPSINYNGSDSFTFTAKDAVLTSNPAVVSFAISPVNDPPLALAQSLTTTEDTALPVSLTGTDIDGDSLTYTISSQPSHGALNGAAPNLTYLSSPNYSGIDSFTYKVSDGTSDSAVVTVSLAVSPVNDSPIANSQNLTTNEDTNLNLVINASDVDGDVLTYEVTASPAHGSLSGVIPNLAYQPDANYNGTDSFTFIAKDAQQSSTPVQVNFTVAPVNDAPIAQPLALSMPEDTGLPIHLNATDVDDIVLSYSLTTTPTQGTLSGTAPDFIYTPASNFNGTDTFNYIASDSLTSSAPVAVIITITSVNDAPSALAASYTLDEDTLVGVELLGTDTDGDSLTYQILSPPNHGALSGTAPNLTYTPNTNFYGTDSFSFVAKDTINTSAPAVIALNVRAVNDTPSAIGQTLTTEEDTVLPIILTESDPDSATLSFSVTSPPLHGTLTGTAPYLSYNPAANFNGSDHFTYLVNDGSGDSTPATASITVTPVNDAPVAVVANLVTDENAALLMPLVGMDIENDPLAFEIVFSPVHGTISGSSPNFTYNPAANYFGTDTFTYIAKDATASSASATVSIQVRSTNQPPVGQPQSLTLTEDVELPILLSATDQENNALSFRITQFPTHGVVTGTPPNLTYKPFENYNGTDFMEFVAVDFRADSAPVRISFQITAVNDRPDATSASYVMVVGASRQIELDATDVDGDAITYQIARQPTYGTVTLSGNIATYTGYPSSNEPDSFDFKASDASLSSLPASISFEFVLSPGGSRSRTFTTTADFEEGGLSNMVANGDQLSVSGKSGSGDELIQIPIFDKSTLLRADTETGRFLAEIRTTPNGINAYAKTVAIDSEGSVWVANTKDNSVTKILHPSSLNWVDRNQNGLLDTSKTQDDIKPWTGTNVTGAADELISLYVKLPIISPKHISVDRDDNLWVGSETTGDFVLINGDNGAVLREESGINKGGDSGLIDKYGVLWSVGNESLKWDTLSSLLAAEPVNRLSLKQKWTVAASSLDGSLWYSSEPGPKLIKVDQSGLTLGEFDHGYPSAQGIAVDPKGGVWAAHTHCGYTVGHINSEGLWLGNVSVDHGPTGVDIDSRGRIWIASAFGTLNRIDPLGGQLGKDGVTPLGVVDLRTASFGGYGSTRVNANFIGSSNSLSGSAGRWTTIYDGFKNNGKWGAVKWNADLCNGSKIQVRVAASNSPHHFTNYQILTPDASIPTGTGKYLAIVVDLQVSPTGQAPILYDLTVGTEGYAVPTPATGWTMSAGENLEGSWPDRIRLNGKICQRDVYPAELPIQIAWTQISGPSQATIERANEPGAVANFPVDGDYLFQMTATLGVETLTDTVGVRVFPKNREPWLYAGDEIFHHAGDRTVLLPGAMRDDGLPKNVVPSAKWKKLSGPGNVSFADDTNPETIAEFSADGFYVLELEVSDTQYSVRDALEVRIGTPCTAQASGVVSWWTMNNSTSEHLSGNEIYLRDGAKFVEGKVGTALAFDGINDYAEIFDNYTLALTTSDLTVEFWIKPESGGDDGQPIFDWGQSGVSALLYDRYLSFGFKTSATNTTSISVGNLPLGKPGDWHHVALSYDQSTRTATTYLNGVFVSRVPVSLYATGTNNSLLLGKSSQTNTSQFFKGRIDEFAIYSESKDSFEIFKSYAADVNGRCPTNKSSQSPAVDAGKDQNVTYLANPVHFEGVVTDDDRPVGSGLRYRWNQLVGPSQAQIANPTSLTSAVSFTTPGIYQFQLDGYDSESVSSDTVEIKVAASGQVDLASAIQSWWPLNGDFTESVTGQKARVRGNPAFIAGKVAGAVQFDKLDDLAIVGASPATNLGAQGSFTVESWLNFDQAVSSHYQDGITWSNVGSGSSNLTQIRMINSSGYLYISFSFAYRTETGAISYYAPYISITGANGWQHVVFTYDKPTGTVRSYLNGAFASSTQIGVNSTILTEGDMLIGPEDEFTKPSGIAIDELTFFKRPLTTFEVYDLYQSGNDGKAPIYNTNQAPLVNAGCDQSILNPQTTASLQGLVTDDALPAGRVITYAWRKLYGPGSVTFSHADQLATQATFSTAGTYTLELLANDSQKISTNTAEIQVAASGQVDLASAIQSWWPLNGDFTESVTGQKARVRGNPAFIAGKVAGAVQFDKLDDLAIVAASPATNLGAQGSFTVESWLNLDQTVSSNYQDGITWSNVGSGSIYPTKLNAYVGSSYLHIYFSFAYRTVTGTVGYQNSYPYSTAATGWQHVVFTYDKPTGTVRSYLNGAFSSSTQIEANSTILTEGDMLIGPMDEFTKPSGIAIDELTFFKRPLTTIEVYDLYQSGNDGKALIYNTNQAPLVNAGRDQSILNPRTTASLQGLVTDDSLPTGRVITYTWRKLYGPGSVTLSHADQLATQATFSMAGTYTLELLANDSQQTSSDTVEIQVAASGQVDLASAILSWWPLNGDFTESVTGQKAWVRGNPTFVAGKVAGAVQFDKLDDLVIVTASPATNLGAQGSFTVESWLNLDQRGVSSNYQDGITWSNVGSGSTYPTQLNAYIDFSYLYIYFSFAYRTVNGTVGYQNSYAYSTAATGWQHVVFTYDKPTGTVRSYLNGAFSSSTQIEANSTILTEGDMLIGPEDEFTKSSGIAIDELTFFKRPLTQSEITELVTAGSNGKSPISSINQAPALASLTSVTLSYPQNSTTFQAVAQDDDLPLNSVLSYQWTILSGPNGANLTGATTSSCAFTNLSAGDYQIQVSVSDGVLSSSRTANIKVIPDLRTPPLVAFGQPVANGAYQIVSSFPVILQVSDPDGAVAQVSLTLDGGAPQVATTSPWGFNLQNLSAGEHALMVTATDSDGLQTSASTTFSLVDPTQPDNIIAEIASPNSDSDAVTAPIPVTGTASGLGFRSYRLELAREDNPSKRTLLKQSTSVVIAGELGKIDPTLLENGIHILTLTATTQFGASYTTSEKILIDGNMKLGQFSLAFEDMSVDLPGTPLTVTRTYDSRDAKGGDFGPGWSLATSSVKVRKVRPLSEDWEQLRSDSGLFNTLFHVEPTRRKRVIVSFPGGRTETFEVGIRAISPHSESLPSYQLIIPVAEATYQFKAIGDTTGRLEVSGNPNIFWVPTQGGIPGAGEWIDASTFGPAEPTRFKYTEPGGASYIVDETLGLMSIADTHGNTVNINRSGITHSSGESVLFTRNAAGNITQVTDGQGRKLFYAYDAQNRLVSMTNRVGSQTTFQYNFASVPHYLTDIFDSKGVRAIRSAYDAEGRMISQTDANGQTIQFNHDLSNRREQITDRLGNITTHEFDDNGNITRTTDALGGVTTRTYDANDNELTIRTPRGLTTRRSFDAKNNLLSETDPIGSVSTYVYDAEKRPLSIRDALNQATTLSYSTNGNLNRMTDPAGTPTIFTYTSSGNIATLADTNGTTTSYTYDSKGREKTTRVTAANGTLLSSESNDYDSVGNRIRSISIDGTRSFTTTYQYDLENRLTLTSYPDGTTSTTSYDANGKPLSMTNVSGTTTHVYDSRGNQIQTTSPGNRITRSYYDVEGRMTASTDAAGATSYTLYDALGRATATILPDTTMPATVLTEVAAIAAAPELADNPRSTTTYDADGRVTAASDALGNTTTFEYDNAGRRTAVINALGNRMSYAFDAAGRQVSSTDARGQTTAFTYDSSGRLTRTDLADGNFTLTSYDSLGRRISATDAEGKVTQFAYDPQGRLIAVTDALGGVTRYAYDQRGLQIAQTDALGRVTTYEYDVMGRRVARVLPQGQREEMTYNNRGQLTAHRDFNGQSISRSYDSATGDLLSIAAPSGHPSLSLSHAPARYDFSYDILGRRTLATVKNKANAVLSSEAFSYDIQSRLTGYAGNNGSIGYGYDLAGNLAGAKSSTASGYDVSYDYDVLNRITDVHRGQEGIDPTATQLAAYNYDANGNLNGSGYANGVQHAYAYNALNRLTALSISPSSLITAHGSLGTFSYTLNKSGHRTGISELGGRTITHTYDALYRLTSESRSAGVSPASSSSAGTLSYTYDPVGNRTSRTTTGPVSQIIPSQTQAFTVNDRLTTDTYDANGNTTFSRSAVVPPASSPTVTDFYSFDNKLIRRTTPDGKTIDLTYNSDGSRLSKFISQGGLTQRLTTYLTDSNNPTGYSQVIEEKEPLETASTLRKVNLYGHDLISSDLKGSAPVPGASAGVLPGVFYYTYDGLGSVRSLTNESGDLQETYDYDAYGTLIGLAKRNATTGLLESLNPENFNLATSTYLYTGEQRDEDLGMVFLRARYFNTNTGRFHTQDTYEGNKNEPLSLHKYLYANGNPISYIDPSGNNGLLVEEAAAEAGNAQIDSALLNVRAGFGFSRSVGGAALGVLGKVVEQAVARVLMSSTAVRILAGAGTVVNGPGGRRIIDFLIQIEEQLFLLEVKFQIPPSAGPALTRLVGQIQTMAAQANSVPVVFSFRDPGVAQLQRVMDLVGPTAQPVQYISGLDGLIKWLQFISSQ